MKKIIFITIMACVSLITLSSCSIEISKKDSGSDIITTEISEEKSSELLSSDMYLPIGTVVWLKDSSSKAMIVGVLQLPKEDHSKLYDYSGVLYPDGMNDPNSVYVFNKSQIERVCYLGYFNEEEEAFQDAIIDALNDFNATNE
jgi:hypothetical protein